MNRIKYYSTNDIMFGYNLSTIDELINKFDNYENIDVIQGINNMIELYNAKKYIDNDIYLSSWSKDDTNTYKNDINTYFGFVARIFNSIDEEKFIRIYNEVQKNYKEDFWELIEMFSAYKRISKEKWFYN